MASINDLATAASAVSALSSSTTGAPGPSVHPDARGDEASVTRGALIVLEGLDRSGKTTQVKLLEQRFVELGRKVKVMRFPGRSLPFLA
jgi:Thymidylate kinase